MKKFLIIALLLIIFVMLTVYLPCVSYENINFFVNDKVNISLINSTSNRNIYKFEVIVKNNSFRDIHYVEISEVLKNGITITNGEYEEENYIIAALTQKEIELYVSAEKDLTEFQVKNIVNNSIIRLTFKFRPSGKGYVKYLLIDKE